MRNPLSAILQCADEIVNSLSEARYKRDNGLAEDGKVFDDNIDAAQTISLCAQHQKRYETTLDVSHDRSTELTITGLSMMS